MAKDPAFLWYPNDYIGGTMGMTFEEKGAYVHLLMMQFNRGHMTSHMVGQEVGQLWERIKDKFVLDENGLYYNVRLDAEIKKRQTFINSRYNNLEGTNQYTKKGRNREGHTDGHMDGHVTSHMENDNICIDKSIVYSEFYDSEILKSSSEENYLRIVKIIFGENEMGHKLNGVLRMKDQLSYDQAKKILSYKSKYGIVISEVLEEMENWKELNKRTSVYKTFLTFMKNKYPETRGK